MLPEPMVGREADLKRFAKRLSQPNENGCIEWVGLRNKNNYGIFSMKFPKWRSIHASRACWFIFKGDPGRFHVLHKCDNPPCVNLDHLFLGTPADNSADKHAKGRAYNGPRKGLAKFTIEQIKFIKESGLGSRLMSKRLGVNRKTIRLIRNNQVKYYSYLINGGKWGEGVNEQPAWQKRAAMKKLENLRLQTKLKDRVLDEGCK